MGPFLTLLLLSPRLLSGTFFGLFSKFVCFLLSLCAFLLLSFAFCPPPSFPPSTFSVFLSLFLSLCLACSLSRARVRSLSRSLSFSLPLARLLMRPLCLSFGGQYTPSPCCFSGFCFFFWFSFLPLFVSLSGVRTPLHLAAIHGQKATVALLLDQQV